MKKNLLQQTGEGGAATTTAKPTITNTFICPAYFGKVRMTELFEGINAKVDKEFFDFIEKMDGYCEADSRECISFKTQEDSRMDTAIIPGLEINEFTTPEEVYAMLEYLNGEGRSLLDLPKEPNSEDEYETNLILGYIKSEEERIKVIFIERELEGGEEELHYHIRPLDRWRTDCPDGAISKPKVK